jgi:hypothetical protein
MGATQVPQDPVGGGSMTVRRLLEMPTYNTHNKVNGGVCGICKIAQVSDQALILGYIGKQ